MAVKHMSMPDDLLDVFENFSHEQIYAAQLVIGFLQHQLRSEIRRVDRSEEHTSELQSLMRISYAVFCLKKKNKNSKQSHKDAIRHITFSKIATLQQRSRIH